MTRIANRSAPGGPIVPTLIYDDVPRAIEWLCDAFGFAERLRAGDSHAQLDTGGGGSVMLGASRTGQSPEWSDRAELRPPRPQEVVNQSVLISVDDVDRHHRHALSRGARILNPPTDYPFGERQYTAEDLAGYRWSFSQSIADVDPRDWGATLPAASTAASAASAAAAPEAFTLVALLYLHPGRDAEYERFEQEAARVMRRYGGSIERRVKLAAVPGAAPATDAHPSQPRPDELHVVRFPDAGSFARYRADPEIQGLAELRATAIRETVIWLGTDPV